VSANAPILSHPSRDRTAINSLSDRIYRVQLPFHPAVRIPRYFRKWHLRVSNATWRSISSSSCQIESPKRCVFNSRLVTETASRVSSLSLSSFDRERTRVNSLGSATRSSRSSRDQAHGCRNSVGFYQAISGFFNAEVRNRFKTVDIGVEISRDRDETPKREFHIRECPINRDPR